MIWGPLSYAHRIAFAIASVECSAADDFRDERRSLIPGVTPMRIPSVARPNIVPCSGCRGHQYHWSSTSEIFDDEFDAAERLAFFRQRAVDARIEHSDRDAAAVVFFGTYPHQGR